MLGLFQMLLWGATGIFIVRQIIPTLPVGITITVSNAHGPLRLHAASGTVAVDGDPADSWNVNTASGNVTVRVPANAPFNLDAHSNSGRIDSDHPITMMGSLSRRQLSGQVRGGGPRLEISTSSGAIRIR